MSTTNRLLRVLISKEHKIATEKIGMIKMRDMRGALATDMEMRNLAETNISENEIVLTDLESRQVNHRRVRGEEIFYFSGILAAVPAQWRKTNLKICISLRQDLARVCKDTIKFYLSSKRDVEERGRNILRWNSNSCYGKSINFKDQNNSERMYTKPG